MSRGRECSIANTLAVIGERWTLLALREIMLGQRRFDQIARGTGASRDILTARLRKLVDSGVLERRQYESHPPRYEYVPTEAGQAARRSRFSDRATRLAWRRRNRGRGSC